MLFTLIFYSIEQKITNTEKELEKVQKAMAVVLHVGSHDENNKVYESYTLDKLQDKEKSLDDQITALYKLFKPAPTQAGKQFLQFCDKFEPYYGYSYV